MSGAVGSAGSTGQTECRTADFQDPATNFSIAQATAGREAPHQHSLRRDTSQPVQSACLAGQPAVMQHKWEGAGTQSPLPDKLCTRAVQRPAHACTSCVMKLLLCRPLLRTLPEVEGVPLDLSSTCRQAAVPLLQDDYSMT